MRLVSCLDLEPNFSSYWFLGLFNCGSCGASADLVKNNFSELSVWHVFVIYFQVSCRPCGVSRAVRGLWIISLQPAGRSTLA